MQADFNGLRKNMVDSFNTLVTELENTGTTSQSFLLVNPYVIERILNSLRTDIVFICGIINPEDGKSILDDEDFKLKDYSFDEDEDEDEGVYQ